MSWNEAISIVDRMAYHDGGDESLNVESEIVSFQDALQSAVAGRPSHNDRRREVRAIAYVSHVCR